MNPMTGDPIMAGHALLERFAHALARIVHEDRPDVLGRTITVAELYQEIAPYRRMRDLAGFELHADYEHALIRFLSGEGGHAQLDPESAADELGIEAESSDPDLSLYRKFAACDLRIALGEPLPPRAPKPEPIARVDVEVAPPPAAVPGIEETLRALAPEPAAARPAPAVQSRRVARVPTTPRAAARCDFCGLALPAGRDVRFCPHCGVDQTATECGACGERLEEGWRFCVACGAAAES